MSEPWKAYLPPEPEPEPETLHPQALALWFARSEDLSVITALRDSFQREFVGVVPVPKNLIWMCAGPVGETRACLGFAPAGEHRIIITDLYDDGTRVGKRGLLALFHDVLASGVLPYVVVPLDKPELVRALVKRGMRISGVSLEVNHVTG